MPDMGVFPVHAAAIKVGKTGINSAAEDMVTIAEMESAEVAIEGNSEEWTPLDTGGWGNSEITGKRIKITMAGKRCPGDPGNDYIAGLSLKVGAACNTKVEIDYPNGDKLELLVSVNVTALAGGESTNIAKLEIEMSSKGAPTYTPHVAA